eukprot:7106350-Pyramimonas_sp.AAC.1
MNLIEPNNDGGRHEGQRKVAQWRQLPRRKPARDQWGTWREEAEAKTGAEKRAKGAGGERQGREKGESGTGGKGSLNHRAPHVLED